MDREFMQKYYEHTYPDPILAVAPSIPNYPKTTKELLKKSTELCNACGGVTTDLWQMIESYIAQKDLQVYAAMQEIYLRGAEDREKMLK